MPQQVHASSGAEPVKNRRRPHRLAAAAGLLVAGLLITAPVAFSAEAPVGLGTTDSFAVLAGSTVTNTGPSVITGNVGVDPGSAVVGFPPGLVIGGTIHASDGVTNQAKSDLVTAYNDAAGRSSTSTVSGDLAGRTLTPGVYTASSTLGLSGALTLDAQGNPSAVFVFQAGSSLIVGSSSVVNLIGGAQACNVYWKVGSSATIGTAASFVGNIFALTSITMTTGATLDGRALARNGAVTLDTNTITRSTCTSGGTTSGGTTGSTTGTGSSTTGSGSTTTGSGSTTTGSGSTAGSGTTKGSTGAKGTTGTGGVTKPKPKPKHKHKPKPKHRRPAPKPVTRAKPPKPVKPATPAPVKPTAPKPPAFTG
jgi:Ice-binding-like